MRLMPPEQRSCFTLMPDREAGAFSAAELCLTRGPGEGKPDPGRRTHGKARAVLRSSGQRRQPRGLRRNSSKPPGTIEWE